MFSMIKQINPFSLFKRMARPLILDGAMGSLLQQKGVKSEGPLWMSLANITVPDIVSQVHREYIEAGADIITTNTFRTNPASLSAYGWKNETELVKKSLEIAVQTVGDLPIFIAGSNAPAEDCYQVERRLTFKEIEYNHKRHIDLLTEYGSHFILNETQSHFDEIKIICEHCAKNNISFIVSLFLDENLKLLSGEEIDKAISFILDHNPLAIGINCIYPDIFMKLFNRISFNFNWGTYLNCGAGNYIDDNITCGISFSSYGDYVKKILINKPSFIGACCGSMPEHIKEIKKIIDGKSRN